MTRQAIETPDTRISRLAAALPCALDDLAALSLEGADAVAFAHAQFASDVAALPPGCWHWTCLLSPLGRVVGFGPLLRPDAERLLWVVPAARADELASMLRRFVLRRRLAIARSASPLSGAADATRAAVPSNGGGLAPHADGLRLDIGGVAGRSLRVGAAAPDSPAGVAAWRACDVLDGLPRLEGDAVDAFTAHALGLQRVGAFSTSKGCYPGQEIVARTHFLGRNKREPRVAWVGWSPDPGARLLAPGDDDAADAMGDVVSAATPAGMDAAVLAVVRAEAPERLRLAGTTASGDFERLPPLAPAAQK